MKYAVRCHTCCAHFGHRITHVSAPMRPQGELGLGPVHSHKFTALGVSPLRMLWPIPSRPWGLLPLTGATAPLGPAASPWLVLLSQLL